MTEPSYKISLRITHPTIESSRIGSELRIKPLISYSVGDAKQTPKGTKVQGTRKETFWCHEIEPRKKPIEGAIADFTQELMEKKSFLNYLSATGGRIEYFIGWFSSKNSGFLLGCELLKQLGELGIDLSLDIYCGESAGKGDVSN